MSLVNYYKKLIAERVDPIVDGKLNDIEVVVYNDTIKSDIKEIKNNPFVDKFMVEYMVNNLVKWYNIYINRK